MIFTDFFNAFTYLTIFKNKFKVLLCKIKSFCYFKLTLIKLKLTF